ncbi:Uncharacterized protein Fot_01672 [Forsythia ovata]|uniref:Uncharacterized protein n=1 Tax=Forsythia ovata TaxID=205694 RepID=A0ABD1X4M4_9LAMI
MYDAVIILVQIKNDFFCFCYDLGSGVYHSGLLTGLDWPGPSRFCHISAWNALAHRPSHGGASQAYRLFLRANFSNLAQTTFKGGQVHGLAWLGLALGWTV